MTTVERLSTEGHLPKPQSSSRKLQFSPQNPQLMGESRTSAPASERAIKQAEWSAMIGGVRTPLGQLVSRKLKSREHTEKAPTRTRMVGGRVYTWGGLGRYVVIQYDTVFANNASAVEKVITTMGSEVAWRVSGYSIR